MRQGNPVIPENAFGNGQPVLPGAVNANSTTEIALDSSELRSEINAIFWLRNDPCNSLLNFPGKFMYLEKMIKGATPGVGNSAAGPTNFAFSESAIIYGITDFVIKRAKEELLEVYLNDWYQKLNNDIIIQPLIPQTLSVYRAFSADNALNIAKYGDKWKNAFQEDLRNIPVQLQNEEYIETVLTKLQVVGNLKSELKPLIAGSDELVYNLYLKKHLVNVLSTMGAKYLSGSDTSNAPVFKRVVLFGNLLTSICGTLENNNNYKPVKLDELANMDLSSWQVFLKLLYVRNKKAIAVITGNNPANYCAIFSEVNKIQQFASLIKEAISVLTSYQTLLSGFNTNAQNTQELTFDDVRKVFDLSFQLLNVNNDFFSLINLSAVRDDYTKKN